jgi:hypothetical protein
MKLLCSHTELRIECNMKLLCSHKELRTECNMSKTVTDCFTFRNIMCRICFLLFPAGIPVTVHQAQSLKSSQARSLRRCKIQSGSCG